MGWLDKILGGSVAAPVDAVGNALDKLFTSDDERAAASAVMEKLRQQPAILQAEINKIEASHRSVFVAGWRPLLGYICGIGLAFPFVINPVLQWYTGDAGPVLQTDALINLFYALLGLGGMRTIEKLQGRAK